MNHLVSQRLDQVAAAYDLVIVGSGFGGAILAQVARSLGKSVLLVERFQHPRFAIGESTSPLMNLLIEELAHNYNLPRLLPLTTYGAWQATYPEIGCGLKRGFSYYAQEAGKPFRKSQNRANELLVAASPNDVLADTHWLRADVDQFLVKEAVTLGVDYVDLTAVACVTFQNDDTLLRLEKGNESVEVRARLLVDATGPRGFLHRYLELNEREFECYPRTQSLYSHFTHLRRTSEMPEFAENDSPPYCPDDAALHHVYEGGWMWILPFNNGVTSAGFIADEALSAELQLEDKEGGWRRFMERFPTIGAQFANAREVLPLVHSKRVPFRTSQVVGRNWLMLPSAAFFIDPLFSTGMPLTLLGIERLARLIGSEWDNAAAFQEGLNEIGRITLLEGDNTARFVAGCHASMGHFPQFSAYAMFYFAAASFSEMARRLDRRTMITRYLAANQTEFTADLHRFADKASSEDSDFGLSDVAPCIERLNVAGLADPLKRNWYGVDLKDVIDNAAKLDYTPEELAPILADADWAQC